MNQTVLESSKVHSSGKGITLGKPRMSSLNLDVYPHQTMGLMAYCVLFHIFPLLFYFYHLLTGVGFALFLRIALQEDTNRMSANALAIVFAPCILRCPDTTDPLQSVQDISKTTT